MMLCMDEYGNVYQASSHRADGRGVENIPYAVEATRDNTLDQSYKKSEKKNQAEIKALKEYNSKSDRANEIARQKRNQRAAKAMKEKAIYDEAIANRKNQEERIKEHHEMSGPGDFERLRIVDANYGAKHAAAMGYYNEKMGTKIKDETYMQHYTNKGIPYSGRSYDQVRLEQAANGMRETTELTKEWAEYQTIPNEAVKKMDLSDENMQITQSSEVESVEAQKTKKSKMPLVLGGALAAYLLLG